MGLCMGAYALGHAGILDGRRAITHWRWLADFTTRFPDAIVDDSGLYVDEGQVITSAGTAAGLDACLHYVRREWGSQPASAIARRMVVAPHRAGNQNQFVTTDPPRASSPTIAAVQERVLTLLPHHVEIDELARWYGTSRRTFDRDFRAAAGNPHSNGCSTSASCMPSDSSRPPASPSSRSPTTSDSAAPSHYDLTSDACSASAPRLPRRIPEHAATRRRPSGHHHLDDSGRSAGGPSRRCRRPSRP